MRCPFCEGTDAHNVDIRTMVNGATVGACDRGHTFTLGE